MAQRRRGPIGLGVATTTSLDSTAVVAGPDGLTSPGEPVFVARVNAHAEDDGYLVSLRCHRSTDLTELLIHDAGRALPPSPLDRLVPVCPQLLGTATTADETAVGGAGRGLPSPAPPRPAPSPAISTRRSGPRRFALRCPTYPWRRK